MLVDKLKRKWRSRFHRQRYRREIRKKWKKKDLHRWRKKEHKLVSMMHKRYAKIKGNKGPYCPRCEARDWKCSSDTDEHDTYDSMKCKYCGWTYSPSHS